MRPSKKEFETEKGGEISDCKRLPFSPPGLVCGRETDKSGHAQTPRVHNEWGRKRACPNSCSTASTCEIFNQMFWISKEESCWLPTNVATVKNRFSFFAQSNWLQWNLQKDSSPKDNQVAVDFAVGAQLAPSTAAATTAETTRNRKRNKSWNRLQTKTHTHGQAALRPPRNECGATHHREAQNGSVGNQTKGRQLNLAGDQSEYIYIYPTLTSTNTERDTKRHSLWWHVGSSLL